MKHLKLFENFETEIEFEKPYLVAKNIWLIGKNRSGYVAEYEFSEGETIVFEKKIDGGIGISVKRFRTWLQEPTVYHDSISYRSALKAIRAGEITLK